MTPTDGDISPHRIRVVRGRDHGHVLREALSIRRKGGVPLVGDERWSEARWNSLVKRASEARVPSQAAWAALTSGTTGEPRIVVRTQHSWDISYPGLNRLAKIGSEDLMLIPVHPVSSMATYAASHAEFTGFRFHVPRTRRIVPDDIAQTTVMHGTPWHLRDVVDLLDAGHPTALKSAIVGGDRLPAPLRVRAEDHGLHVVSYFGAAELSLVAADAGDGLRAFPGVDLEIRDGILWVRTSQRALAVLGTGSGLRADGPWATVGDRARLNDGLLELHGRDDDAILTAGATVIPAEVEDVLNSMPGVSASLVLGIPNGRAGHLVAAAIETNRIESPPPLTSIQDMARRHLTPAQLPRLWKTCEYLPRTGVGKIRRLSPEEFQALR
ncbi:AMP-binding protein [Rothia uropygioeca]|uniref:AMP-binding protein n=1 Tax=Kocuria sp. 257 TaxID=2021970 RepID=UPI00101081C6|nr:AMP-binding protein [Kocuria sp. 257]